MLLWIHSLRAFSGIVFCTVQGDIKAPEGRASQQLSYVRTPLLFLLLGAALGQWWFVELAGTSEVGVVLTAVVSAGFGLLIARHYARRLDGNSAYEPSLIRVLGQPLSVDKMINATSKDSE